MCRGIGTMPRNVKDYSQCDFDDLKAWLKMAHEEFGLYTIVRPGPFICAEWAGGGYPRWVAKFCPAKYDTSFWLRSNHPEHMKLNIITECFFLIFIKYKNKQSSLFCPTYSNGQILDVVRCSKLYRFTSR